jgi:hypothetical protein
MPESAHPRNGTRGIRTSWHVEEYTDAGWRVVEDSAPRLSRAHNVWRQMFNDGKRVRLMLNGHVFTMAATDEQLDLELDATP